MAMGMKEVVESRMDISMHGYRYIYEQMISIQTLQIT